MASAVVINLVAGRNNATRLRQRVTAENDRTQYCRFGRLEITRFVAIGAYRYRGVTTGRRELAGHLTRL